MFLELSVLSNHWNFVIMIMIIFFGFIMIMIIIMIMIMGFNLGVGGSHLMSRELYLTKRNSSLVGTKLTVQRKSNLVSRRKRNLSSSIRAEYRYATLRFLYLSLIRNSGIEF